MEMKDLSVKWLLEGHEEGTSAKRSVKLRLIYKLFFSFSYNEVTKFINHFANGLF